VGAHTDRRCFGVGCGQGRGCAQGCGLCAVKGVDVFKGVVWAQKRDIRCSRE
jgi:hypothetical protein